MLKLFDLIFLLSLSSCAKSVVLNRKQLIQWIPDYLTETQFNLDNMNMTAISNDTFVGLSQLKILLLQFNELTRLDSFIFKDLNNLQLLGLGNNNFTFLDSSVFSGLIQLQALTLSFNQLASIASFSQLSQLQVLDLSFNKLSSIDSSTFNG